MGYDLITLGRDRWSRNYWKRISPLPYAMLELVEHNDATAYLRYWKRKYPQWAEHEKDREAYIRALLLSLTDRGYEIDGWRDDPRNLDPAKGSGPMCCTIGPHGDIWPMDGAHRSALLRAIGEPVVLHVHRRNLDWLPLRSTAPYKDHPDYSPSEQQ